jgi:hypothetical protein
VISRSQPEADRAALLETAGLPGDRFWPAYWADRDRLDHGLLSARDYWRGIGRASGAAWDDARLHALWAADLPHQARPRGAVPDGGGRILRSTWPSPRSSEYRRSKSSSSTTRRATWQAPSRSA